MDLLANDWDDFKNLISVDGQDTFCKQTIIWRRVTTKVDPFMEDNSQGLHQDITLKCLCNYNYMRSWPVTNFTESGGNDRQSTQVLFTKEYLRGLGYLNADGYFDYNPVLDKFILDGLIMEPAGDSSVSQAGDDPLLQEVILVRQPTTTGTNPQR
jgi:hypothetical protein